MFLDTILISNSDQTWTKPMLIIEPCREKTGLRGLQTRSNTGQAVQPQSDRRWLEAWNFGLWKNRDCTIYEAKTQALISCVVTV